MRYNLIFTGLILFHSSNLSAQSNSNQNNSDLKKATTDLKKSVQGIEQLFKKKKNDSANNSGTGQSGVNQSTPPAANSNTNNQTTGKINNSQGLKPGDILPGAKYIDADQFSPFNEGAAIIRKGNSFALIDPKGNFIIPFNVYSNLSFGPINNYGYTNGLTGIFSYSKANGESGFINAEGKILAISQNGKSAAFAQTSALILISDGTIGTFTFMDKNGKSYTLKENLQFIQEGVGEYQAQGFPGTGFKKLTGEVLATPTFEDVSPFADGMALVAKADQFGERKYGYLDHQGKLAVPLNFSIKPGLFASGYAKVEPKDKSEFEYAFINKQGSIVLKQSLADINKYGKFDNFKTYGLAFSQFFVLDSTMKITSQKDFFKSYGIMDDNIWLTNSTPVLNESNPKLYFSTTHARNLMDNSTIGFICLKTKKMVSPVFELPAWSSINYFDPVSHLLYAKICTGRDASHSNAAIYREGYINEDGYFVILKGTGSKW